MNSEGVEKVQEARKRYELSKEALGDKDAEKAFEDLLEKEFGSRLSFSEEIDEIKVVSNEGD